MTPRKQFSAKMTVVASAVVATFSARPVVAEDALHTRVREAAERGIRLLQGSQEGWYAKQSCSSCHHQYLPAMAFREAREHGLHIDERAAEDRSNEAPMEACMQVSLFAGEFARVEQTSKAEQDEQDAAEARFRMRRKSPWSAEVARGAHPPPGRVSDQRHRAGAVAQPGAAFVARAVAAQ